MSDDSQYLASNFLKKNNDDQYLSSNFERKKEQPGYLRKAAEAADYYINRPAESMLRSGRDLLGGHVQGVANIIPGIYNLGASGINALGANVPKSPMIDIVPHTPSGTVGEISSFFSLPGAARAFAKIPGIRRTASSAMKIPLIAESVKHASKILSKNPISSKIAGNAILGGAYSPDNPLLGLALGGAAPVVGKGVEKTYNALKPSKLFRGNLTPEQLQHNLNITEGTETGLGDVIGSPFLKRMNENVLSKIPGTGVNNSMHRNAEKIISRGEYLINRLAGKSNIGDLDQYLNDALKKSYESHNLEKNALFNSSNQLADEIGLELDLPGFANKVKQYKNAIEDTNILKYEPEMQALLRRIRRYENPVKSETKTGKIIDKFGNPLLNETTTKLPKLKESNLLKGKLNSLASMYGASPNPSDRHLAGVFGRLANHLKKDIISAIKKSGNEKLLSEYTKAETNYANKFSSFLDNDIYKFINGKADSETLISSFIKTGKSTDRGALITKVMSKLPFKDRNLLGHAYLQRAMDENNVLNPLKLKTLLSKNALGNKQFEALFPNRVMRNALRNYVDLVNKNTKSLKLMENPETGQMNMDILPLLSRSPMSLGAKMLGAPIIAKKLRSEETRNKLINKIISNERNKK